MRKHSLFIAGFQHKLNMYSPKTQRKRNHTKNTAVYNYIRAVFKKHKYNTIHTTLVNFITPQRVRFKLRYPTSNLLNHTFITWHWACYIVIKCTASSIG